jgi:hypothetical protein
MPASSSNGFTRQLPHDATLGQLSAPGGRRPQIKIRWPVNLFSPWPRWAARYSGNLRSLWHSVCREFAAQCGSLSAVVVMKAAVRPESACRLAALTELEFKPRCRCFRASVCHAQCNERAFFESCLSSVRRTRWHKPCISHQRPYRCAIANKLYRLRSLPDAGPRPSMQCVVCACAAHHRDCSAS